MRLNVRQITHDGDDYKYFSYMFEDEIFFCSELYDKTEKIIYEKDICEYNNNEYYEVNKGKFEYKNKSFVGWYLQPIEEHLKVLPLSQDIADEVLVVNEEVI